MLMALEWRPKERDEREAYGMCKEFGTAWKLAIFGVVPVFGRGSIPFGERQGGGDASLQQPYLMKKFIEITKKDREFIMKAMDCTERMVFKGIRFEKTRTRERRFQDYGGAQEP